MTFGKFRQKLLFMLLHLGTTLHEVHAICIRMQYTLLTCRSWRFEGEFKQVAGAVRI